MPRPKRTGLKDVARVDRQQRRDAAEQHGKEIERDGAKDGRMFADEADAGEEIGRGCRILLHGRLRDADRAGEQRGQQPEQDHDRVSEPGRDRISEPAQRGSGDGCDLRRAARQGGRALQRTLRRDQRQQRCRCRTFERARRAEDRSGDENLRHRQPARIGAESEKKRGQRLGQLTELHDALALVTVGGVSGDQDQKRGRQELHQSDHAEQKGAGREIIDLPADRDRRDLAREA